VNRRQSEGTHQIQDLDTIKKTRRRGEANEEGFYTLLLKKNERKEKNLEGKRRRRIETVHDYDPSMRSFKEAREGSG